MRIMMSVASVIKNLWKSGSRRHGQNEQEEENLPSPPTTKVEPSSSFPSAPRVLCVKVRVKY